MIIRAPESIRCGSQPALFLAGGITGCPDWQKPVGDMLNRSDLTVFNPRRSDYEDKPLTAVQQITWEYAAIQASSFMFFWFPRETDCPITLFELGCALSEGRQTLVVGCEPGYSRHLDVVTQCALRDPEIFIHDNVWGAQGEMYKLLLDPCPTS